MKMLDIRFTGPVIDGYIKQVIRTFLDQGYLFFISTTNALSIYFIGTGIHNQF